MKNKSKRGLGVLCVGGLTALDLVLKRLAVNRLPEPRRVLPGILGLRYVENTGVSFSFFGGSRVTMLVITMLTGVVLTGLLTLLVLGKFDNPSRMIGVVLVSAGGFGNLIDRVRQGYVVDYLELLFMRFAIFNFADVCISLGGIWICVLLILREIRAARLGRK